MNYYMKIAVASLFTMLLSVSIPAEAQNMTPKKVFMFGFAQSFNDSTVYFTDIQVVDSAYIEHKTKFLADRQLYSFQLQRYLEENYKGGPYVPSVFFSKNRKRMERKYLSLHKRYASGKGLQMVLVDQGQFRFKPEEYIEQEEIAVVKPKKKDKKK